MSTGDTVNQDKCGMVLEEWINLVSADNLYENSESSNHPIESEKAIQLDKPSNIVIRGNVYD